MEGDGIVEWRLRIFHFSWNFDGLNGNVYLGVSRMVVANLYESGGDG